MNRLFGMASSLVFLLAVLELSVAAICWGIDKGAPYTVVEGSCGVVFAVVAAYILCASRERNRP